MTEAHAPVREDRAARLLAWYDVHARDLPWRIGPAARRGGARPDPYRVWLSEIMLQQTTVAAVRPYFEDFTVRWPDVTALNAAAREDVLAAWAGLGYYARARNMLACAAEVTARGGVFPETEEGLLTLPGIGPYTAAAIAAIAFDRPAVVVDGNVERVMARLLAVETPLPAAKPILRAHAEALTPKARPGDYAQAAMDLGATICTPKSPACGICPWMEACAARRAGIQASLPKKTPKAAKPVRRGEVFALFDGAGGVLTETRPDNGLLGGMLGLPGTAWTEAGPDGEDRANAAPVAANWRISPMEVRHTFTHFHLVLTVLVAFARVDAGEGRRFTPIEEARSAAPTAMRKALDAALAMTEAAAESAAAGDLAVGVPEGDAAAGAAERHAAASAAEGHVAAGAAEGDVAAGAAEGDVAAGATVSARRERV